MNAEDIASAIASNDPSLGLRAALALHRLAERVEADHVAAARQQGAAAAAQAVSDTIKESDDGRLITRHLDRARLWAVQTPQTFRVEVIRRALAKVREKKMLVTDDTAACELIGQTVQLVCRAEPNPKVTRPEDVPWVEMLLRNPEAGVRRT